MSNRTITFVAKVATFLTFSCLPFLLNTPANNARQADSESTSPVRPIRAEWRLGSPVTFGNLTIFPVTARKWSATDQFITLDAALKSGKVKITEMGADSESQTPGHARAEADVNQVSLRNDSAQPLLLLAGEMLLGGQQDRIDASDRIVPPSEKPTPLAVFCVEPGRWNGAEQFGLTARADRVQSARPGAPGLAGTRGLGGIAAANGASVRLGGASGNGVGATYGTPAVSSEAAAETVTVTSLASDAMVGGIANARVRDKAEVSRDQVQVWNSVALTAHATNVETRSGSLQHVYDDKKVSDRLNRYTRAFSERMGANVVGVVVAINGKAQLADIFASPSLFRVYWPKLLKSYVLEALSSGSRHSVPASIANARSFLSPVKGEASTEGEQGVYRLTRHSAQGQSSFELEFEGGPAPVLVHFNRISSK
jgi:hypothetical protein